MNRISDQDSVLYHLKMAAAIAIKRAKAFCRKVTVWLVPSSFRSGLESKRTHDQSLRERTVISPALNYILHEHDQMESERFAMPDLDLAKSDFKEVLRHVYDELTREGTDLPDRYQRRNEAIDLGVNVRDHIDDCSDLNSLVELVDKNAPTRVRAELLFQLGEIISMVGSDSTLSGASRNILASAVRESAGNEYWLYPDPAGVTKDITSKPAIALKAFKDSFLELLENTLEYHESSLEAEDRFEPALFDQEQLVEKAGERRESVDSGFISSEGSFSRSSSLSSFSDEKLSDEDQPVENEFGLKRPVGPEDVVEKPLVSDHNSKPGKYQKIYPSLSEWLDEDGMDSVDDVFEPEEMLFKSDFLAKGYVGKELDSVLSAYDQDRIRLLRIRTALNRCTNRKELEEFIKLVEQWAPESYKSAMLSRLSNSMKRFGIYLE